ncbi:transcription antitermination factor NusB [Curvibacter sp. HBC61]|uniref:Transcription antitermination protein NusB n=1 Tax=Curvibacter cyanobacteriorum TaxID=3026422 RepID=A0ABT5MWC3_9BURK|nr:transcription antitermination factor NusB [Curvibacter sp. HBC61]MDD0837038.1 transcription antitermination factor NusB [Curvibacter sp. HBC61]
MSDTPQSNARPPRQPRKGTTSTGARKAASKSDRSRAREFALQALYQFLVGKNDATAIDHFTRDLSGFHKADAAHYNTLLHGCVSIAEELDARITPLLDRKLAEISPIEHAVMWIGAYELQFCPDVPWRVVLNECIELTKEFGGTDGHKYVNAVLNGLAPQLRAEEVANDKQAQSAKASPAPTDTPAAEGVNDPTSAP